MNHLFSAYLSLDHCDYITDQLAAARRHSLVPVDSLSGVYFGPDRKESKAEQDKRVPKDDLIEDKTDGLVKEDVKDPSTGGDPCLANTPPCQDKQDKCQQILLKSGRTEWF